MGWPGQDLVKGRENTSSHHCHSATNVWIVFATILMTASLVSCRVVHIRGEGASFPKDVYVDWITAYRILRADYLDVNLTYLSSGSSAGIDAIMGKNDYSVNYAGSDTVLSATQQQEAPDLVMFPTMAGAVVASYNIPELQDIETPLVLSLPVLVGIYNGTILYWNHTAILKLNPEFDLPYQRIIVVARSDGSGTTFTFTSALDTISSWQSGAFKDPEGWPNDTVTYHAKGNQGMAGLLLSFPYSIGYISASGATNNDLPKASMSNKLGDVVHPTIETVQASMDVVASNVEDLTANLAEYASHVSYPIASFTYLIIRKTTSKDCEALKELIRYSHWCLTSSDAQDMAKRADMVPLSGTLVEKVQKQVLQVVTCSGENVWEMVEKDFDREKFDEVKKWLIPVLVAAALLFIAIFSVTFYMGYKKIKFNQMLDKNEWEIPIEEVLFYTTAKMTNGKDRFVMWPSVTSLTDIDDVEEGYEMVQHILQWPGKYNGFHIGLRLLEIKNMAKLQRRTKKLLLFMQNSCHHNNILKFYGLTEVQCDRYIVSEYCSKGPLNDILKDMKYNLNKEFKYSLLMDILHGLAFLHSNDIIHGYLCSSLCLVDIKWTVKIADWEYCKLYTHLNPKKSPITRLRKDADEIGKEEAAFRDFWSAPELVKSAFLQHPTTECDIYSFCIILQEIWTRNDPYYEHKETMSYSDLLKAVVDNQLRPTHTPDTPTMVRQVMDLGWSADVSKRPSANESVKMIQSSFSFKKSVLDTVMEAVDEYTATLEERLARRTADLDKQDRKLKQLVERNIPVVFQTDSLTGSESTFQNTGDHVYNVFMVLFKVIIPPVVLEVGTTMEHLAEAEKLISAVSRKHNGFAADLGNGLFAVFHGLGNIKGASPVHDAAHVAIRVTKFQPRNGQQKVIPGYLCAIHKGMVCAGLIDQGLPKCHIVGESIERMQNMLEYAKRNQIISSKAYQKSLTSSRMPATMSFTKTNITIRRAGEVDETYWLQGTDSMIEELQTSSSKSSPGDNMGSNRSTPASTPTGWRRLLGLAPRRSSVALSLEMQKNFTLNVSVDKNPKRLSVDLHEAPEITAAEPETLDTRI